MLTVKIWLLNIIYATLDNIPPFLWNLLHVITDIYSFWFHKLITYLRPHSRVIYYEAIKDLDSETSYKRWLSTASTVDEITGANLWRRNFFSRRYDFNSVMEQYSILIKCMELQDFDTIREKFSTTGPCMLRNFAGIVDKKLFTKSLIGTKLLIEQYLRKIVESLELLSQSDTTSTSFFQRCKLSLGTTALILQGGSLFGLFHLGVIKGLLSQNLMPNIISGSSMGACIAACYGCCSNDELIQLLDNGFLQIIKNDVELLKSCGYGNVEQHLNLGTLIQNLIHHGYSQDVYLFIQFVLKYIVKDTTFEEAYQTTKKVFNVVIHPTDSSCPNLLNYVTTPNVLISSAIKCSLGSGVLSNDTILLCKNLDNKVVPFLSKEKTKTIKFLAPEHSTDTAVTTSLSNNLNSPYTRLTELFNVNNFIVSLARPYLAPLVVTDLKHEIKTSKYYYYKRYPETDQKYYMNLPELGIPQLNFTEMEPLAFKFKYHLERKLKNIITMEFHHRMQVLDRLGLLSSWIKRLTIDEKIPRSAMEISIVPKIKSLSITRIIEGQLDNIPYWINCGERSTWPVLALIKTRCIVEFKLDEIIKNKNEVQENNNT
ncbi:hypothetical protein KAFR_0I02710 [Kazachstania africana CBS 2517]|uniref:PNPLA domain-containing protein n=1 Tax=Kazachstania africana (strain ATCC 22294 / BCRC 22015 / CBS 2517 / CECT 1963 / NBRC 1671 / NRRL Y-8276) TaxID=1071382 RepID=H2B0A0_KAZAF|nr:hypothetical protein KAFR_0I02710 [Kazachstania africana CBS 2517]CCF60050.1 hypothetical protein KAFR_0I02710 [Kazachstania africana CBS 2517]